MKKLSKKLFLPVLIMGIVFIIFTGCKKEEEEDDNTPQNTVTDIDGNVYHFVTIGSQVWMVENLKTTKYRDGTAIPNVTDNAAWINLGTGAYCNYSNTAAQSDTYGRLYNWYAITDSRNLAPEGWHIPSSAEWQTLVDYLGGTGVAGGKLKETGTTHWLSPNTGASDTHGFAAFPGGLRNSFDGAFQEMTVYGLWWCSTSFDSSKAWYWEMGFDYSDIHKLNFLKKYGCSVRCIKN
ncbi:MAG TPA: fibrobacter succinogenes major paralogous domain-containing protein [Bacteroidales bacterium]|nr:fibrobacter succinogenes major paralogous domain-containing protein [Bacteroidales bacterium]